MSRDMKRAQGIENACCGVITNFAAIYEQGFAGGRNATAGFAAFRLHFASFCFA
jgi:hypothetical protein